jgi:hypothetical protein
MRKEPPDAAKDVSKARNERLKSVPDNVAVQVRLRELTDEITIMRHELTAIREALERQIGK